MSHTKNANKTIEKSKIDSPKCDANEDGDINTVGNTENCTYAVTVSKKTSSTNEIESKFCSGQKSFISIHSTDQLCQVADIENPIDLEECNVEVLSLNEVFPSTSEDSLSNEDDLPDKKKKNLKRDVRKSNVDKTGVHNPINNKSPTISESPKECVEEHAAVCSDYNIPNNTLYVIGSNPGEPKISYPDPPKKMSKTMKKFLRNIDKHRSDSSKSSEKAVSKLTTMRGILKDGRCGPECTGDSTLHEADEYIPDDLSFAMDFGQDNYNKQNMDKNVSFNTQVLIFHFTGDLCVGQSIETLSKEKDQQERNSELRRTFLTKYNELWPTQK